VIGAERWIKLEFAREYVLSRQEIGKPLPEDVVASINPPDFTPKACQANFVYISYPNRFVEGDTGLEIDDPATISNSDLDELLSRWTCAFIAPSTTPQNYPQVYTTQRGEFVSPRRCNVAKEWLKNQLAILESTGVEDSPFTLMILERLGGVFECDGCHSSIPTSWYFAQGVRIEKEKPKQTKDMMFSTMVSFTTSLRIPLSLN